jgi:hypothetical protein
MLVGNAIPSRRMTERAKIARATLTEIEKGDPAVSIRN